LEITRFSIIKPDGRKKPTEQGATMVVKLGKTDWMWERCSLLTEVGSGNLKKFF